MRERVHVSNHIIENTLAMVCKIRVRVRVRVRVRGREGARRVAEEMGAAMSASPTIALVGVVTTEPVS